MSGTIPNVAGTFARSRDLLCSLPEAGDAAVLASAVVRVLRELLPGCSVYACLLDESSAALAACDASGAARNEWTAPLAKLLRRAPFGGDGGLRAEKLPAKTGLKGGVLLIAPLACGAEPLGAVAAAVPAGLPPDEDAWQRAVLLHSAAAIADRIQLLRERAALVRCRAEVGELQRSGEIAEVVGPVLHEVGNLINNIVLEASGMERQAPEELRNGFHAIRSKARQLAALLNRFSDYRSRRSPPRAAVDLNQVVRDVLGEIPCSAIAFKLADGLPPVSASKSQLKHLLRLLLGNAAAVTPPGGTVEVTTQATETGLLLKVRDRGRSLDEGELARLFDIGEPLREGDCPFDLAACKSIARRLRASLEAGPAPEGGVLFTLEFPTAS